MCKLRAISYVSVRMHSSHVYMHIYTYMRNIFIYVVFSFV